LGSRFPALISATGRCVAAFNTFDKTTLRSRFDRLNWDNPPGFETWIAQVEQTRRDGYGVDRGEYIGGMTIIAAPLFDASGAMRRSLVAIGMSEKMESTGIPEIAHEMLRMRDDITRFLMND
jgi:DNA-binding IclR family transcriptional regulator